MTREKILKMAADIVTGERENQYGSPEDNFQLIGDLWTQYLGCAIKIDDVDVAMMMCLLKIARFATGTNKADTFIDIAGYAACAGELATKGVD